MSGCRVVPKGETTTTVRPTTEPTDSDTSDGPVTESTDFGRFLKTTTAEPLHAKRNTENGIASEIEDFFSTTNFTDYNETDVFIISAVSGGSKSHNGGGLLFKHDIMPFENKLENTTEYRMDVEEMFQKLDNRRPIREVNNNNSERTSKPEKLTPFKRRSTRETLIVRCHNAGTFFSARERWWYIAISNCGNDKGLDISYRFKMTNGQPGDFWSEHYSADEMRMLLIYLNSVSFSKFVFFFFWQWFRPYYSSKRLRTHFCWSRYFFARLNWRQCICIIAPIVCLDLVWFCNGSAYWFKALRGRNTVWRVSGHTPQSVRCLWVPVKSRSYCYCFCLLKV